MILLLAHSKEQNRLERKEMVKLKVPSKRYAVCLLCHEWFTSSGLHLHQRKKQRNDFIEDKIDATGLIPCPTCGISFKKTGLAIHRAKNKACLSMRCQLDADHKGDEEKKCIIVTLTDYVVCNRCGKRFARSGVARHLRLCLKQGSQNVKCVTYAKRCS